jgi:hypothetical protein
LAALSVARRAGSGSVVSELHILPPQDAATIRPF